MARTRVVEPSTIAAPAFGADDESTPVCVACGQSRSGYSEHFQLAADPVAARVVLNALDPQNAKPVPCSVVLPFTGGPPGI